MDRQQLREKILYPVTRVRAGGVGGSGVLVYSQPDPKDTAKYINLALTCQHVVDKLIKVKEEWDAVLKRDRKRDFFEEATIEVFDYDGPKVISSNATQADVLAYDKRHDLAVVRLHNYRPMPFVATIIPETEIPAIGTFDPVWVSGCSLLHDPFASPGTLTYLREIIEQKEYLMANAPAIFGNSGGGLFHGESTHLLGLTSRVTVTQLGFNLDIQTWMEFSTHPKRLYEFFRDWELQFMFDPKDDYYSANIRREKRRKEAMRTLLMEKSSAVVPEDVAPVPTE